VKNKIDLEKIKSFKPARRALNLEEAIKESSRCLLCEDAPCSKECPAGTDPARFIRQIRFSNYKGAARTIRENNVLGAVCAEICPTEKLCEKECTHRNFGEPINISGLQSFACEYGKLHDLEPLEVRMKGPAAKIAVIGAGPAGLSCAAELAKMGYLVTIFEKGNLPGGVTAWGIPSYRLSTETLSYSLSNLESLGIKIEFNKSIPDQNAVSELFSKGFKSIFVGAGLCEDIDLDIYHDYENALTAGDFLKNVRDKKESLKDKVVAVIGGGSVAMDVSVTAIALGAKKTYAISLEGPLELPATTLDLELAREMGVIFRTNSKILNVIADKKKIVGLKGIEIEWKLPNNFKPDNAVPVNGTEFSLKADLVVQAVGSRAGFNVCKLEGIKGVFIGGDIAKGPATVVQAVGDGKKAAIDIDRFIREGE